jgi:hypothetical protein
MGTARLGDLINDVLAGSDEPQPRAQVAKAPPRSG